VTEHHHCILLSWSPSSPRACLVNAQLRPTLTPSVAPAIHLHPPNLVPIPTYILGPIADAQLPKFKAASRGGDLLENLTYLGQQGVYVMPSGLKLA
jgi:hypothetical protein